MKKEKEIIVYSEKILTREERKNFRKDHPGYRLAFPSRYPYFGTVLSFIAVNVAIASMLINILR